MAYLGNGLVLVLAPRFAGPAFAAMALLVFVGELSLCHCLFNGVEVEGENRNGCLAAGFNFAFGERTP